MSATSTRSGRGLDQPTNGRPEPRSIPTLPIMVSRGVAKAGEASPRRELSTAVGVWAGFC